MTQPSLEGQNGVAARHHLSSNFPAAPMIFGGVIAIFLVIATLAGIEDGRNPRYPRSALVPDVAPVEPEGRADLGREARSGQLAIAVTEVTVSDALGDPRLPQTVQVGHVLVGVRVVNDGADGERFEPAMQQLVVGDQTFGADREASLPLLGADLGPGDSVVASIAFDVPAGAEPSAIILRDSLTDTGTQVSLAGAGISAQAQ
ncbi:DUF4352 domain-containing protein [Mycobacteroides sp. LB1]|uniref:DUF4352 domain-containing protein n=1 Tax=Mycobacteroides sp. LB1 TaxID=2750814 RepID=UPI0015DFAC5A|nr:DUF4352 domain-containing protein [Mycobacteroides sp. LB1]